MRLSATLSAAAVILTAAGTPVLADDDPAHLVVGAGAWEAVRPQLRKGEFDIAYRPAEKLWIFKPHFGVVAAGDGDVYGYGGFLVDLYWGSNVVTTLSTAVGVYGGNGFNLGSHVEFRSGADLAWRFADATRLGVGFYHLSNANLTSRNPGSESLVLLYSYPIN